MFHKPVSITDHPKINEWLTLVEKEMRNTLARLLAQSVQDCATFLQDKIDIATFNKWLDSYQVNGIPFTKITMKLYVILLQGD